MKCNSQGALAMMRKVVTSPRTKNVAIAYHIARQRVAEGTLVPTHVLTGEMVAHAVKKAHPTDAFEGCLRGMDLTRLLKRETPVGECCAGC